MAIFHRLVQAPSGTVAGTATITIDFDDWSGRTVKKSKSTAAVKKIEQKPAKKLP